MGHWISLISATAMHDYFNHRICRTLTFSPTAGCIEALQQHQLLARQHQAGFELLADLGQTHVRTINNTFRMHGYSSDPHFASYTDLSRGGGKPLYYRIQCSGTETSFTEADPAPDLGEAEIARTRGAAIDQRRIPSVIVDVAITTTLAPDAVAVGPMCCSIELKARQLYWKYILGGELASKDLELKYFLHETPLNFERCEQGVSNVGAAFQSTSPIALHESPPQRIQLVEAGSGKILMKRLPNAGPRQLGKSKDRNGNEVVVAEIYVNQ